MHSSTKKGIVRPLRRCWKELKSLWAVDQAFCLKQDDIVGWIRNSRSTQFSLQSCDLLGIGLCSGNVEERHSLSRFSGLGALCSFILLKNAGVTRFQSSFEYPCRSQGCLTTGAVCPFGGLLFLAYCVLALWEGRSWHADTVHPI